MGSRAIARLVFDLETLSALFPKLRDRRTLSVRENAVFQNFSEQEVSSISLNGKEASISKQSKKGLPIPRTN